MKPAPPSKAQGELSIKAVPWGPSQSDVDAATRVVLRHPEVLKYLRGTNFRKLSFELISTDDKSSATPTPPTRFRTYIYDYTNNRNIIAEGSFANPAAIAVSFSLDQPPPSEEEFAAAKYILSRDPKIGAAIRDKSLKTYHPMPPVLYPDSAKSRVERTIMVGLTPSGANNFRNEVVGVNMTRRTVVRYESGAPPTSMATAAACGIAGASQTSTSNGTAGTFQVVVSRGGTELWNFLAVRPSASSGNSSERSGIELQNVKYRGKSVLKRAHVPVLNVKYDGNVCGPFRDWQYQEGMFQTDAAAFSDIGPGFRITKNPATTSLESGNDTGNFRGVAVYTEGSEVVLVSELNAGWYRYIHEWRLDDNGTIRPRYGFGATNNSCVCAIHHHHVYWRFDFDITTAEKNAVFPVVEGLWQPPAITNEGQFFRNQATQSWMVKNTVSGDSYKILPGNDGTAYQDPLAYGKGDVWVLLYRATELDDPNTDSSANIDAWVNNESVNGQDIVIWYGGHFDHTDGGNIADVKDTHAVDILSGSHVIGPDLIPLNW
ncbi:MAG: hypothetical protein WCF57_18565 [Pyrinomonadaceae bacterium]